MSQEPIVNRVANSPLINLDLTKMLPQFTVIHLDLAQFLDQGLVLREQHFRNKLKFLDRKTFKGSYVRIYCSTEAIIPAWTNTLIAAHLANEVKKIVTASPSEFELILWMDHIAEMNLDSFRDRLVLIKGCGEGEVPPSAQTFLVQRLTKIVKKLMFGEACSFVPLYKSK